MKRELKKLCTAAWKASHKTKFSCYPMAPALGLSDKEVAKHRPALEAHAKAAKALKEAGLLTEAQEHEKMKDSHSWAANRIGCV